MRPQVVHPVLLSCLVASCLLLITACGASRQPARASSTSNRSGNTIVITAAQIERAGVTTVWQALRRLAPQLRTTEHNGRPSGLQRRGQASILLQDAPLVFLDGVRLEDFRHLDLVPASSVETISILGLADGATYYGVNAVGGVILIRTKAA